MRRRTLLCFPPGSKSRSHPHATPVTMARPAGTNSISRGGPLRAPGGTSGSCERRWARCLGWEGKSRNVQRGAFARSCFQSFAQIVLRSLWRADLEAEEQAINVSFFVFCFRRGVSLNALNLGQFFSFSPRQFTIEHLGNGKL